MTTNWTQADNFNAKKAYTAIHWGEQSKVLEVELMEMQKILKQQSVEAIRAFIHDGFVQMNALQWSSGSLVVPAPDIIFANGSAINLSTNLSIPVSAYPTTVYLAVWEADLDYSSTIETDGNQTTGTTTITNDMIDSRLGVETSHRTQRQTQLVTSNTDNTKYYLPIATVTASGVFTDNRNPVNLVVAAATFTGLVTASTPPTSGGHLTNRTYVDAQVASAKTYAP